jgi:hypothetical protein
MTATEVVVGRGIFVVSLVDGQVWIEPKVVLELGKTVLGLSPREQLLADEPKHLDGIDPDQPSYLP